MDKKIAAVRNELFLEDEKFYTILAGEHNKIIMVPNFLKTSITYSNYSVESFQWMKDNIDYTPFNFFSQRPLDSELEGEVFPFTSNKVIGYRIMNGKEIKELFSENKDLIFESSQNKDDLLSDHKEVNLKQLFFDLDVLLFHIKKLNKETIQEHFEREFFPFEIQKTVSDFFNIVALARLELEKDSDNHLSLFERVVSNLKLEKRISKMEKLVLDSERYGGMFNPLEFNCRIFQY